MIEKPEVTGVNEGFDIIFNAAGTGNMKCAKSSNYIIRPDDIFTIVYKNPTQGACRELKLVPACMEAIGLVSGRNIGKQKSPEKSGLQRKPLPIKAIYRGKSDKAYYQYSLHGESWG